MRIALLCPTWGDLGGIERKAESLVAEFRRRGHPTLVVARGRRATSAPAGEVPVHRLPLRHLPSRSHLLLRRVRLVVRLPGLLVTARRLLRTWRADVVLSLAVSSYTPYTIGLARAFPLVFSIETAGPDFAQHPRALRWAFRRAARVVACASSLAASARALAPEAASRVVYVPNGVDLARFAPEVVPYPHGRPYVLAVGRLAHQKGFDVLLEAWALAGPAAAGVDLLLAGDGPDRAALERQAAELGIAASVHFLGSTQSARLAALYRGALLLACPSRWEGLPLVCLEAMASGCPVVGSDVDGIPDAVTPGETGLLVPPREPTALAGALTALLGDPARRAAFGARARAIACARFGWPVVAGRYLDVLTAACGR
ncbi:MAG TPA: glycosyltransferase family 4 protein [Candidatus Binatia bacterium]|nr:glycosyltransferase family 4 protein [Candidatus Binatia bacterium]